MLQLNYKKTKNIAPFSCLGDTARAKVNCAISPKPFRVAEELAKGNAKTFLNGCEGDGRNGGEGLQSTKGRGGVAHFAGAVRFIIMRRKQRKEKNLKGGN